MPTLSPNAASAVSIAVVVVHQGNDAWLPYNQAVNTGGDIGISDRPALPGNPMGVYTTGLIPLNVLNLGAGNASPVVVVGNTLQRGGVGLTQIGNCDASGRVTLFPAYLNTSTNNNTPVTSSVPQYVTALSSYAPSSSRQAVAVDAYGAAGDGGGGTFVWNPTDTRAADGGTIIAVAGIATGRWNRILPIQRMNVQWFGADNSGNTGVDAACALAAAAAAARNMPLYFPPGNYVFSGTLSVAATVSILGDNPLQTTLEWVGATNGIVWGGVAGAQDTAGHTEGLRLVSTGSGLDGLRVQNAAAATVERCVSSGWTHRGVAFVDTILSKMTDTLISNCGGAIDSTTGGGVYGCFEVDSAKINGSGTAAGSTSFTWINNTITGANAGVEGIIKVDRTAGATFIGGTSEAGAGTVPLRVGSKTETVSGVKGITVDGGIDFELAAPPAGVATTVAAGSDGVTLPIAGGVLNVAAISGYPTTGTLIVITADTGPQTIYYTGISGTTFTGCTGGTGTLHTSQKVSVNGRFIDFGYGLSNSSGDNRVDGIRLGCWFGVLNSGNMQFDVKCKYTTAFWMGGAIFGDENTPSTANIAAVFFDGTTNTGMALGANYNSNTDAYVMVDGAVDPVASPSVPWTPTQIRQLPAPVSTPATPASGYILYIDSGDSKLKAVGSSGTVSILAAP